MHLTRSMWTLFEFNIVRDTDTQLTNKEKQNKNVSTLKSTYILYCLDRHKGQIIDFCYELFFPFFSLTRIFKFFSFSFSSFASVKKKKHQFDRNGSREEENKKNLK